MPLHISSTTKSVKVQPQNSEELRSIIEREIEHQGPDADLNFINTSLITNMTMLFRFLDIGNIKIDQWDVSNVTSMESMFAYSKKFNCDLSKWNVSKVTNMAHMFYKCSNFNCDLSKWDVHNLAVMNNMLDGCEQFKSDLSNWDLSKVLDGLSVRITL